MIKNPPASAGDTEVTGSIPGSERFSWRRKLQPTPVFLPGKSHGQKSLEGYGPWGHTELDTTEHTHTHSQGALPRHILFAVQFSHSVVSNTLWPHGLQHARLPCPSPSPGVYSNSSVVLMMPSSHLILCHPLLLLPSFFPSIKVFSNESAVPIRWPKYWSFSFTISPSNLILKSL